MRHDAAFYVELFFAISYKTFLVLRLPNQKYTAAPVGVATEEQKIWVRIPPGCKVFRELH
jgi:hypothetical protein